MVLRKVCSGVSRHKLAALYPVFATYHRKILMKPTVNTNRLLGHLNSLAKIGPRKDGGVCRLAFSKEDLEGRNYVANECRKLGLEVRIDPIGNLFGILPGKTNLSAVMIGSHTDTVGTGGRLDGALGVLAALECANQWVEKGEQPARTLIVASFVNEEGVRFMPDMMGSLFHSGKIDLQTVVEATDSNGITVGEELTRLNYGASGSTSAFNVGYFLELHIEQGPELEAENLEIGVVSGVQGLSWQEVTVEGQANHAGTTPMHLRKDAGAVSTSMMSQLRLLPEEIPGLRLTIGSVTYEPNLINVIPERVQFSVDVRHPDEESLKTAEARIRGILNAPSVCSVTVRSLARVEPCQFAQTVVSSVENAAEGHGYAYKRMISGAGHDAQILSTMYQSGMVFIPSRGGISHNPAEYSTPEHIVAGANVLYGAVMELMNRGD